MIYIMCIYVYIYMYFYLIYLLVAGVCRATSLNKEPRTPLGQTALVNFVVTWPLCSQIPISALSTSNIITMYLNYIKRIIKQT